MAIRTEKQNLRGAIVLLAVLASSALPGMIAAARAQDSCAGAQERIELQLRRDREFCTRRAAHREARGLEGDYQACEARQLRRYGVRMHKAGCTDGASRNTLTAARPPGEVASALVEILGQTIDVEYENVGGRAILQGDIDLGSVEEVQAVDSRLRRGLTKHSGTATSFGWPNNRIPFKVSSSFSVTMQNRIQQAINHWNAHTIVRLQPRAGEADFVQFAPAPDGVCNSPVGKQGGAQTIHLGSDCDTGNVIHEIGHSVGLFHEQSRNDRNNSIKIHLEHVMPGQEFNFVQYSIFGTDRGVFDFNSIMLYDSFAFSKDNQPTITKVNGTTYATQRDGLSTGDIAGVTMLVTNHDSLFTLKDKLKNRSSGRCMTVSGSSAASQAAIVNDNCTGASPQRWYFYTLPQNGRQILINDKSGLCVDVPGSSNVSGLNLQQFPCHGGLNQSFTPTRPSIFDPWTIKSALNGQCVRLDSGNRLNIEQHTCSGDDLEKWDRDLL